MNFWGNTPTDKYLNIKEIYNLFLKLTNCNLGRQSVVLEVTKFGGRLKSVLEAKIC